MITIDTQITIEASPETVWGILIDFNEMSAWNPFIRAISGSLAPGSLLSVRIAPPGQAAMTFEPTVLVAEPARELRWVGTAMTRWIFAGEHYFVLDQIGPSATRLTHGETFSGILAPLIMRGSMLAATKQGFAAMNEQLKIRAE
jgi:hypothetical protein